jgi:hypothetical protein
VPALSIDGDEVRALNNYFGRAIRLARSDIVGVRVRPTTPTQALQSLALEKSDGELVPLVGLADLQDSEDFDRTIREISAALGVPVQGDSGKYPTDPQYLADDGYRVSMLSRLQRMILAFYATQWGAILWLLLLWYSPSSWKLGYIPTFVGVGVLLIALVGRAIAETNVKNMRVRVQQAVS